MGETEYYCINCGAQIKPTDTVCPKCGKNLSEVGKGIKKILTETLGISESVSISHISGSIAQGYADLSSTFDVRQKNIADSYNLGELVPLLKQISESSEKRNTLAQRQREEAMEDAKRQRRRFYISTAIAIVSIIVTITVAIIVWVFPRA